MNKELDSLSPPSSSSLLLLFFFLWRTYCLSADSIYIQYLIKHQVSHYCHVLFGWFLARLILQSWRWWWYVPLSWRWWWYVPLKHWAVSELHGVTTRRPYSLYWSTNNISYMIHKDVHDLISTPNFTCLAQEVIAIQPKGNENFWVVLPLLYSL
jgi:hypothetical protein